MKLVKPATLSLSFLLDFGSGGTGEGDGVTESLPERRKLTLDSSLLSMPGDFSFG